MYSLRIMEILKYIQNSGKKKKKDGILTFCQLAVSVSKEEHSSIFTAVFTYHPGNHWACFDIQEFP